MNIVYRTGLAALMATVLLIGNASTVQAHEEKFDTLVILHPWSRATAGSQKVGAVFMEVQSTSGQADRLIGASTPDAESVEVHDHIRSGDMIQMRRIDGVDIPARGSAVLQPGGKHLMLIGLKFPLFEDMVLPMTLTFEKAGPIEIEVIVEAAGTGRSKAAGNHQEHGMSK